MGVISDGSTASYYELPDYATELQHLIAHRNMNAQIGEIFRACYRYGLVDHSSMLRDAKKIRFYAEAEIERLERIEANSEAALARARLDAHKLKLEADAQEARENPRWSLTDEQMAQAQQLINEFGGPGD